MRETEADLWTLHARGAVIAVTTNLLVPSNGRASLGRGCARDAGRRFRWFAERLGALLLSGRTHVALVGERIVAFPVESHPLENPDLRLIVRSAHELVSLTDAEGWSEVVLPRPGCGGGGLAWSEVAQELRPILDDRFLVVTRPP